MTALDWKPVSSAHHSYGWTALTKHDEIDIQVTVTQCHAGPRFCPCKPAECVQPDVPYVLVAAVAFMPMVTIGCGTHVDLAEYGKDVHTAGGTEGKPGDVVNEAAASLMQAVTAEARQALAELAGHAARLGIQPEGTVTRG